MDALSHVRTKWDNHIDYTSSIPTINLMIYEAVQPIEEYILELMTIARKAYSIPKSDFEASWNASQEKITLMAQDSVKIGFEMKARNAERTVTQAWEAAVNLLDAAKFSLVKDGVQLIRAAVKKKKLPVDDPRESIADWHKEIANCQSSCFHFGFNQFGRDELSF